MVNFIELSNASIKSYKEAHTSEYDFYKETLFVAISEDDKVSCAYDSKILDGANKCFLIHRRSAIAITNWNSWYKIEFINQNGINNGGILENDCLIDIDFQGRWANQVLKLSHGNDVIFSCIPPFERHMQEVWDAYCKTFNKEKDIVSQLKEEVAQKEEKINELVNQVSQYKSLFEKIKETIQEFGE